MGFSMSTGIPPGAKAGGPSKCWPGIGRFSPCSWLRMPGLGSGPTWEIIGAFGKLSNCRGTVFTGEISSFGLNCLRCPNSMCLFVDLWSFFNLSLCDLLRFTWFPFFLYFSPFDLWLKCFPSVCSETSNI